MSRTAVCVVFILLYSPFIAHSQDVDKRNASKTNPNDLSSNDYWANALWLTLPSEHESTEQITANFTAALKNANTKAPIYVSFGDAASGPAHIRESFNKAADTHLPQIKALANQEPAQRKKVLALLDKLTEEFEGRTDASLIYYQAAIAEDPDYLPAWFRLAKHAEGERSERAIRGFMERDPKNALAFYMLAAKQVERGDFEAALRSLQTGNSKPKCQWYPAPIPKTIRSNYPSDKFTERYDVAGKPIAREALMFLIDRYNALFSWADPLPSALRNIGYEFTDKAEQLKSDGKLQQAAELLEAAKEMGLRLISVTPRDSQLTGMGMGIVSHRQAALRSIYQAQKAVKKLTDLERDAAQLKRLHQEFEKVRETPAALEEDLRSILLDRRNPLAEEHERLEQALVKSGLRRPKRRPE
jgi:tetratricopeptide (TPR) repeat protein